MTLKIGDRVVVAPSGEGKSIAIKTTEAELLGNSATVDNSVLRANGTDGKSIQGSPVIIDDSGNVAGLVNVTVTKIIVPEIEVPSSATNFGIYLSGLAQKLYLTANAYLDVSGNFVATSLKTIASAAHLKLSGYTIAAEGTDTNIDIYITPKGTGKVNIAGIEMKAIPTIVAGTTSVSAGGDGYIDHNLNTIYHTLTAVYVGSFSEYYAPVIIVYNQGSNRDYIQVINAYDGKAWVASSTIKWIAMIHNT